MFSKRAQSILYPILLIVTAFVVVVLFAGIIYVMNIFTGEMVGLDVTVRSANLSDASLDTFGQLNMGLQALRLVAISIILGMALFTIVGGIGVRYHPLFFIGYVIIGVLAVILSVPVSNAYETLVTDQIFDGTLQTFTFGNWVLLNLPVFVAVITIFGSIFMFGMMLRDQQSGGEIL